VQNPLHDKFQYNTVTTGGGGGDEKTMIFLASQGKRLL
jgi:hypothetical protein